MIMRFLTILLGMAVMANLTGCATIVGGTHEKISIATPPTTNAACLLSNDKGKWIIANTPGQVKVHRSIKPLVVSCHKPGYHSNTMTVASDMKAMVAGNVVFGGFIGAGMDAVDGAAFSYPKNIDVPLRK